MSTVSDLQRVLKALGHYRTGKIDGIRGPKTEEALEAARCRLHAILALVDTDEVPAEEPDAELLRELEQDEGCVLHAYQDSLGYTTIGIGRLIDKRRGGGITRAEAEYLKANDIKKVRAQLDKALPWWRDLDPVRRRALQNMGFQLGVPGLLKFKTSLGLIRDGRWPQAAANLRMSLWAKQTPQRARRVIHMIEKGRRP